MGSRYGGLKQIEKIGPNGESLAELTAYDAWKHGCTKIILITREDAQEQIKEKFSKISKKIKTKFVLQKNPIRNRVKPLGTGHAVLCAENHINEPFIVANADDYYGSQSIKMLIRFLQSDQRSAIMTFPLRQTLSIHGGVSRGVCKIDKNNNLTEIKETHDLNEFTEGDPPVSMNLWGFQPSIFGSLKKSYKKFIDEIKDNDSEFLLPGFVQEEINQKKIQVKALYSGEKWCGVTYKEDFEYTKGEILKKFQKGIYPADL